MDPSTYVDRNRKPIEIGQRVKVRATHDMCEREFEGEVIGVDCYGQVIVTGPEYRSRTIHGESFTTAWWYVSSDRLEDGQLVFDTENRVFRLDQYDSKRNWLEVIDV